MMSSQKKRSRFSRYVAALAVSTMVASSLLVVVGEGVASATSTITEASGFPQSGESSGLTSLTVTTVAAGDLLIFQAQVHSTSLSVTNVQSTGAGTTTTWHLAERYVDTINNVISEEVWWAVVTAPGSTTITATYSGSLTGLSPELVADSFHTSGASNWSVVGGNGNAGANSSGITFPSLSSDLTDSSQLYWGYVESTQTAVAGSTAGFTYASAPLGNLTTFNDSLATNTAYAPTATATPPGDFTAIGVIFAATATAPTGETVTFDANAVPVSGSMGTQTASSSTNLYPNAFARAGYTFSGWNTLANGTGTSYADGASFPFTTGTATLYAQWATAPFYAVTFNGNNQTSGTMTNETANSPSALTTNAYTKTGATFAGWNTLANGTGTTYLDGATYAFNAALTLYAQWNVVVTFNANASPVTGTMSPQTASKQTNLDLNTYQRAGFTFAGWNTVASGVGGTAYADGASFPFAVATTLYAQWTPNPSYTVTFNGNNATSGTMAPEMKNSPTALTTNAFVRTGYTFTGWNTAALGGGTAYADGASYPFTANVTLYAQWTVAASYTVTFNGNNATSGTMATETTNSPTALTTNAFSRSGYTFAGWNTAANGTGTAYGDGATYPFTASATLYAQWTPFIVVTPPPPAATSYTVTFDGNGATSGTMSPETASAPSALSANAFSRSGYTFAGWSTSANGTGSAYGDGAAYLFTASTTLYAQWTPVATSHTVTFNGNGSTSGSTGSEASNAPSALPGNAFSRPGYTFVGWNTAPDGSGTSYAPGATYAFSADLTLYAQWTANSNTVTFVGNGANHGTMRPEVANAPTPLTRNAFSRTHFVFTGWNTSANGRGVRYTNHETYSFQAQLKLFAQWRRIPLPLHASRIVGTVVAGTNHVVMIVGAPLQTTARVMSDAPGTTIRLLNVKPTHVEIRVTVKPGTPPGQHHFTIVLHNGKSCTIQYTSH